MDPFPHRYVVSSSARPQDEIVLTSPGIPSLTTVTPPEFDGPGGLWSPETLLVKGDTVFMCADCGEKFIQPPPKLKPNASSPPSASSL